MDTYEYVSKDTEFVWPSVVPSADCVEPAEDDDAIFLHKPAFRFAQLEVMAP